MTMPTRMMMMMMMLFCYCGWDRGEERRGDEMRMTKTIYVA